MNGFELVKSSFTSDLSREQQYHGLRNISEGNKPLDLFVASVGFVIGASELSAVVKIIQARVNAFSSKFRGRKGATLKVDGFYGPVTKSKANKISSTQWKRFFGNHAKIISVFDVLVPLDSLNILGDLHNRARRVEVDDLVLRERVNHLNKRSLVSSAEKALLDKIAKGEGTLDGSPNVVKRGYKSGYDVTYSYGKYTDGKPTLTKLTLGEIFDLQAEMLKKGSMSTAVGMYQFIRGTLAELVEGLKLPMDSLFDGNLQDFLAITYLKKRGLSKFLKSNKTFKDREVLAYDLSRIWASVENPRTGKSFYTMSGKRWRPGAGTPQPVGSYFSEVEPLLRNLA